MDKSDIQENTENIQEGEEVVGADMSQGIILKNLEDMIRSSVANIEKLRNEMTDHRDTIESELESDEVYRKHSEAAKEANKIKSSTKAEVMKRPGMLNIANKMKSVRAEIKELQESLSEYLQEYERMSGSRQIEDENGDVREIVYFAKLIRR
ncbi:hypothetical protein C4577_03300 [Candidatus Parcubacteria bacterium]|nr:MAG: hypothetical protein C4577_03300 [Candidatus Parcubacteria bacterium]